MPGIRRRVTPRVCPSLGGPARMSHTSVSLTALISTARARRSAGRQERTTDPLANSFPATLAGP